MDYTKYKEECKEKWLNENCKYSQLLSNSILRLKPDIGTIIQVENIDIPENIFKEEFDQITSAYFSVIRKLNDHYKKLPTN